MNHAPLPVSIRVEIADALGKPHAGIRNDQPHALETTRLQMLQETRPTGLVFLGTFTNAEDLTVAIGNDGDCNQQ